ncbi:MAG: Xaa-Pro dipeptidase [Caulobacter vibrioides]|uniref:Xaa-Pro dipeptidase n=1 Tax=Caulobacter vibrioides TaxID=155892 RepID=A0A258DDD1_CAUVI|nr:MAG: Xaa-Pro dipeptidase [Caulobacter vibrioides]
MRKWMAGACALAVTSALAGAANAQATFVQAGRLLADPATGKVETAKTLVLENGKVTRVLDGYVAEPGGKVVDLKDSFVLPGLIDSHVHLTGQQNPNGRLQAVTQSPSDSAMVGAGYARKTLMAGFTTVANLGANSQAIFALREGIKRGDVAGPRILASGSSISVHGGHGDINGYSEDVMHALRPDSVCSGADDCRRAVREQIWLGADLIKITATGGVLSNTAAGLAKQFSDAELAAIVESAHSMGRKVTAHAHGGDGINAFLKAGGDSIEHGTYLDNEGIALMKKSGGYLVPTLMAGDFVTRIALGPNNYFTPAQTAKALEAGPKMLDMVRRAHAGGVKIAFGTDSGVSAHGDNAGEFALLVKAGLTPLEAIQTATVNAADHFSLSNEIGSLTPGKAADLIAVKGDPLKDVTELQRVTSVIKGGVVYK